MIEHGINGWELIEYDRSIVVRGMLGRVRRAAKYVYFNRHTHKFARINREVSN